MTAAVAPSTGAPYDLEYDLTVERLGVSSSADYPAYSTNGSTLTIGQGGFTADSWQTFPNPSSFNLGTKIKLGADQTWGIDAIVSIGGQVNLQDHDLRVSGSRGTITFSAPLLGSGKLTVASRLFYLKGGTHHTGGIEIANGAGLYFTRHGLGAGEIVNHGALVYEDYPTDAPLFVLDRALPGSGNLQVSEGQLALTSSSGYQATGALNIGNGRLYLQTPANLPVAANIVSLYGGGAFYLGADYQLSAGTDLKIQRGTAYFQDHTTAVRSLTLEDKNTPGYPAKLDLGAGQVIVHGQFNLNGGTISGTAADGLTLIGLKSVTGQGVFDAHISAGQLALDGAFRFTKESSSGLAVTLTRGSLSWGTARPFGQLQIGTPTALYHNPILQHDAGTLDVPIAVYAGFRVAQASSQGSQPDITIQGPLTLHNSATIQLQPQGKLTLGEIALTSHNLSLDASSGTTILSGPVSGTGSLKKQGYAPVTITGANTYSGGTTVQSGRLIVANSAGSATGTGSVTVAKVPNLYVPSASLPTLEGSGFIAGNTTIGDNAILHPGAFDDAGQAGTLASGDNLTLALTSTLQLRWLGADVAHVTVDGALTLAGKLDAFSGFNLQLSLGEVIPIITLTGDDVVTGTFTNAPDGFYTNSKNEQFRINYADNVDGGSVANDVTLTMVALPEPSTATTLLLGSALFLRRPRRRA